MMEATVVSSFDNLDSSQRDAVFSTAPHILVAAPPGSGKTRVLAARFARLVSEGAAPESMAALTFTTKSAMEMAARVEAFIGRDVRAAHIGTFHALCLGIIKISRPDIKVLGRSGQIEALQSLGVKKPGKAADRISFIKNCGAGGIKAGDDFFPVYERYEAHLAVLGAVDLDGLIIEAARLLEQSGGEAIFFDCPLLHIMIDEYQDINPPQARLLHALARGGANVFAIGDEDQAIYSFRGASLNFFLSFKEEWPGAVVMNLHTNYRSASAIVFASSSLIRHNYERLPSCPGAVRRGGSVTIVTAADEGAVSRYIIKEIESRMGGFTSLTSVADANEVRVSFSDFAVLFRTRASARGLIEAFGRANLPYHFAPASAPAGHDPEKFLLHLRGLCPGDGVRLFDIVKKESDAAGLEAGHRELLLWLASRYGDKEAGPNIEAFIEEARVMAGGLEPPVIKSDKVNLMTIHAAKGLEFKTVFIAGMEEGLIPLCRDDTSFEEERRLFYVGLTRAADEAVLLVAGKRRIYGRVEQRRQSRFIAELGDGIIIKDISARKQQRRKAVQKGLFD